MQRIDSINARPDENGTGKAGFNDNADLPGQDATYLTPVWLNALQEEICNLLEKRGISLDINNRQQLFDALAGKDDLQNLLSMMQELVTTERTARIAALQAHSDALNPHSQYVQRKIFVFYTKA